MDNERLEDYIRLLRKYNNHHLRNIHSTKKTYDDLCYLKIIEVEDNALKKEADVKKECDNLLVDQIGEKGLLVDIWKMKEELEDIDLLRKKIEINFPTQKDIYQKLAIRFMVYNIKCFDEASLHHAIEDTIIAFGEFYNEDRYTKLENAPYLTPVLSKNPYFHISDIIDNPPDVRFLQIAFYAECPEFKFIDITIDININIVPNPNTRAWKHKTIKIISFSFDCVEKGN